MPLTLSVSNRAALRYLHGTATPPPWRADKNLGCKSVSAKRFEQHKQARRSEIACTAGLYPEDEDAANAALIVTAVNALLALLDQIDAQDALIADAVRKEREAIVPIIAAYLPSGPYWQPNGTYAGHTGPAGTFVGDDFKHAALAWADQVATAILSRNTQETGA